MTLPLRKASRPAADGRVLVAPLQASASDRPHDRMWGFADSQFRVEKGAIYLDSGRYSSGGQRLPGFPAFVHKAIGMPFDPDDRHEPVPAVAPAGVSSDVLLTALRAAFKDDQISTDDQVRLRHGHGHHLEEIYLVLYDELPRAPDVVCFVESDDDVLSVLRVAAEQGARVIPFGGGTCVSMGLCCTDLAGPIISIDMSRMADIEWVDPVERTASIQGGAVGRLIEDRLREHGFTLGHEPDSIEFSTIGGWVATAASGMKKNRYGNIEDIVLDVTVVTRQGVVSHPCVVPRASHGLDVRRLAIGSEGLLGVITRVTVKLHPAPEVQRYGSLVFPSWAMGLAFLEDLSSYQALPASVRLVDNLQFQFGRALRPASRGGGVAQSLQRFFVTKIKGIDLDQMVACTLVFEGDADEQGDLARRVERLARRHGGFPAGAGAGKDGYSLTFGIAYIRDFLLQYWTMGDSFETAVPWGKVDAVIAAVKAAVSDVHARFQIPGHAFVTARVSQLYTTGCCVYFYIAFHYKTLEDPLGAFRSIEHAAREAILDAGGSLSHHHGVGRLRAEFLPRVKSEQARVWIDRAQRALDPEGLFRCGNQGLLPLEDPRPPRGESTRPSKGSTLRN